MSHKPTPISLITICLATSRLTKRATSLLLAVVLLASIYTTALNLSTNSKVYAAPTPDSCFAINASTPNPGQVTITNYYDHQNNDNLQPACTRDPEIPTTLGGESVTHIGYVAFCSKNLTSVILPSSLQVIADGGVGCGGAFRGNSQLTTITIPNSVVSIGSHAFYDNSLTSVTIGSSVTGIGDNAFNYNDLTTVTIPNSVNDIGYRAFASNNLSSLSLGSSVANIGQEAFRYNQLTTITISNSVVSIGDHAFAENSLTSATIGSSVTSIDNGVFSFNQLTALTIPSSVTSLGDDILYSNPLQSVTYDGNTYTPNDPLIDECYDFDSGTGTIQGLYTINLTIMQNNNNACIGSIANIPASIGGTPVTAIGDEAFVARNLTSVVLPSSVTGIGSMAFAFNQLAEATIPSSVTALSPMAFASQTRPGGTSLLDLGAYDLDPQIAQDFLDSIFYMRIYVDQSQATLLGLTDGFMTEADFFGDEDINQDGDTTDVISAHLINPAAGLISYSDGNGNELQPDDTVVGDGLYSYLAIENPTNDFNLYYRLGSTQTFTPPVISGYPTPPAQTVTLTQGQTAVGFVYGATTNSPNANGNTPSSGNLAGLIPGVPNTGFQLLLNNPLATLTLTSLAAITILYISRRWARR